MRYFIAFLPLDPVSEVHRMLVRDLATRFGFKISKSLFPTHFTIKAPFEATAGQISDLKKFLFSFTQTFHESKKSIPFTIHGFKSFDKSVIALNVLHSPGMELIFATLSEMLKCFPWLTWGEYEPLKNFHITIAKDFPEEKFDLVWEHVADKQPPHFDLAFDHIALLREEGDEWIVASIYPFK